MSILKREQALVFKARANPQVYAFTSQLIMYVLKDSSDWPKSVAKVTTYDIYSCVYMFWGSILLLLLLLCVCVCVCVYIA